MSVGNSFCVKGTGHPIGPDGDVLFAGPGGYEDALIHAVGGGAESFEAVDGRKIALGGVEGEGFSVD